MNAVGYITSFLVVYIILANPNLHEFSLRYTENQIHVSKAPTLYYACVKPSTLAPS